MSPRTAIIIQLDPADTIQLQRYPAIQRYDTIQPANTANTIQPANAQFIQPIHNPNFSSYTTYPADAPLSECPPFPAASAARHLLSSSAAVFSAAFFASNLDGAVSKANFWPF